MLIFLLDILNIITFIIIIWNFFCEQERASNWSHMWLISWCLTIKSLHDILTMIETSIVSMLKTNYEGNGNGD